MTTHTNTRQRIISAWLVVLTSLFLLFPQFVFAVDSDGDGVENHVDNPISFAWIGGGEIHSYRGNGDGTFRTIIKGSNYTPDLGFEYYEATLSGDLNGDGITDLLYVNENGGNPTYMVHYLGDGDGTFTDTGGTNNEGLSGENVGQDIGENTHLGDVDGDGYADLVFVREGDGIYAYLGDGDGTFNTTAVTQTVGAPANWGVSENAGNTNLVPQETSHMGDFNGDGKMDLGFFSEGSSAGDGSVQAITYLAGSNGVFSGPYNTTSLNDDNFGHDGGEEDVIGDFNNDGYDDVAHVETGDVTVWLGNGDGTFAITAYSSSGMSAAGTDTYQNTFAGDIDGDGDDDVFWVHESNHVRYIESNGDGTFAAEQYQSLDITNVGYTTGEMAFVGNFFADYDNDGITDESDYNVSPGGVANGLEFWIKANTGVYEDSNGTDTAESGDTILAWHDKSPYQNHLDDGTGGDPEFTSNQLNNNPVVDFDGNDRIKWQQNNTPWFEGDDEHTHYSIGKSDETGSSQGWLDTDSDEDDSAHVFTRLRQDVNSYGFAAKGSGTNYLDASLQSLNPFIFTFTYDGNQSGVNNIYDGFLDGKEYAVGGSNSSNGSISSSVDFFSLGNNELDSGDDWDGFIAEMFTYEKTISAAERIKIDSYLSIKYGITLDQSTAHDYVMSNNVTSWDASANSTYDTNIAGISRDDNSGLDQRQSKSVNDTAIIKIANGTSASNPSSFSSNNKTLIWGHEDTGSAAWVMTTTSGSKVPPTNYELLDRVYKVQETGGVDNVTIELDTEDGDFDVPALTGENKYHIIVDTDADGAFDDETPVQMFDNGSYGDQSAGDDIYTTNAIDFDTGELFIFAQGLDQGPPPQVEGGYTDGDNILINLQVDSGISISDCSDVTMLPTLGLTEMKSVGNTSCVVKTTDRDGYVLTISETNTDADPAMENLGNGSDIDDYTEASSGTPEAWDADSNSTQFGFSALGSHVLPTFTNSGAVSSCETTVTLGNEQGWIGFSGDTNISVSTYSDPTFGETTTFCFAVEQNGVYVDSGTYQADLTLTATVQ